MKFTASSADMLNHLQNISRVINAKNTLPILDNFLLKITNDKLEMTASDLETTMVTSMPIADTEGEGEITVRAALLLNTLKEFPDQPLTFEINTENLGMTIVSESGHYDFNGDNADQYPQLPTVAGENQELSMPAADLFFCINKTAFAAATDETRPIMTGIYFDITEDTITTVATDAHKMVRIRDKKNGGDAISSFTLPKKPTALLKNVLPKEEGDVNIKFDSKNIFFTVGNYTLVCRQIEGNYPSYNSVIPTNSEFKLIVTRNAFISALKRVSIYANQASNLVKLELKENDMTISAQDLDYSNSAEEKFSCQYDGGPMTIGFKSSFLVEMLSNLTCEEVEIDLQDPQRAALLLPFDNEGDSEMETLMMIMPVMI